MRAKSQQLAVDDDSCATGAGGWQQCATFFLSSRISDRLNDFF